MGKFVPRPPVPGEDGLMYLARMAWATWERLGNLGPALMAPADFPAPRPAPPVRWDRTALTPEEMAAEVALWDMETERRDKTMAEKIKFDWDTAVNAVADAEALLEDLAGGLPELSQGTTLTLESDHYNEVRGALAAARLGLERGRDSDRSLDELDEAIDRLDEAVDRDAVDEGREEG